MDPKQFIRPELMGNLGFLQSTLSDFSDAELFVRPWPWDRPAISRCKSDNFR